VHSHQRELDAAAVEERVRSNEQSIHLLARERCECRVDLLARAGLEQVLFKPKRMAGRLHLCQDGLGSRSVARIDEHAELLRPRQQLAQEPYPLSHRFCTQIVEAGHIAARPSQTGDKPEYDRIFGNPEYDGDRVGCVLGRARPGLGARRGDDADIAANEVGREFRGQIEPAFGPAIFDGDL